MLSGVDESLFDLSPHPLPRHFTAPGKLGGVFRPTRADSILHNNNLRMETNSEFHHGDAPIGLILRPP